MIKSKLLNTNHKDQRGANLNRDTASDAKTAFLLAAVFALLAAIALPSLLQMVPPEERRLPLPVPVFSILLALQSLVVYGLFALIGLRLARQRSLDPAPVISRLLTRAGPRQFVTPLSVSFGIGMICGSLLLIIVAAIRHFVPQTLPQIMHPSTFAAALLASAAASVGEEILCRLFVLSALLRVLPVSRSAVFVAILFSALIFGVLHAPAMVYLFGGLQSVPALSWVWLIFLNGVVGIAFGVLFKLYGIEAAILAHFGNDLVWHAIPQFFA